MFVSFYAFDPSAGRLRRKRIKLNRELAKISGKRAKKEYAEGVCSRLREELSGGFNPWIDQSKNLVYSRFDDVCDQYKVLVMAESTEGDNPKKGQKPKKVGHIKMVVIPDSKKETIDPIASNGIDGDAKVVSDGTLIMNFLYKHPSENRMKFTKLKVACKYASIERGCA